MNLVEININGKTIELPLDNIKGIEKVEGGVNLILKDKIGSIGEAFITTSKFKKINKFINCY